MSLQPPAGKYVGQIWVDPLTAKRFIFTGENVDETNYGWVVAEVQNAEYEYQKGEDD